jgi:hypothetical protein
VLCRIPRPSCEPFAVRTGATPVVPPVLQPWT